MELTIKLLLAADNINHFGTYWRFHNILRNESEAKAYYT